MKITELMEGYKPNKKCKTPDAIYSSKITPKKIEMTVKTPFKLDLSEEESEDLEADMHYAMEKVLAHLFKKD